MTPAVRSHSLRDGATVTARRMLDRDSTSSCPRSRRALVIHTPCASTSSTTSYMRHSSPAMSNDGVRAATPLSVKSSSRPVPDRSGDPEDILLASYVNSPTRPFISTFRLVCLMFPFSSYPHLVVPRPLDHHRFRQAPFPARPRAG